MEVKLGKLKDRQDGRQTLFFLQANHWQDEEMNKKEKGSTMRREVVAKAECRVSIVKGRR